MSKFVKSVWERWIKSLALYAILWAAFRYWLNFDDMRSIVFAFLFGSCYFGFQELYKKNEKVEETNDFVPYRVTISIHNQRDFLFKYKFAKTEDDWGRICKQTTETSIFSRGMNFTVLSLSKNGLPHLIWWDDYKIFLAGTPSFEEAVQGLEFPSKFSLNGKWSPRMYFGFRHGNERGYKIALCVREEWWETNKTENIEIEKDHNTGSIYMIFGALPYGELGLDYEIRREDRKTELEKLGWTVKDIQHPEYSGWDTIEVQNEYFSVSQQFLETN